MGQRYQTPTSQLPTWPPIWCARSLPMTTDSITRPTFRLARMRLRLSELASKKPNGRELRSHRTPEPGQVTETVQVSTTVGETVNTTSGEVARLVDQRQVQNLALNGRNYMQLVTLIPGAVILDEDQLALTTSLSISQAAVNGNRPNYNNLTVDGGFNMDSGSNNSQINNVGIDFVQEVKIQTSNFSAEYGRNAGAAVNVVTRSGSNSYHGSVFEFFRNDKLDARRFFAPVRATLRFNNFGWNFNGPIKKDKFFFFVGKKKN